MAKKKQVGNGSGTVYPRKNKDAKIASYLGSYFADGKRRYVAAKTKTECREKLRQAMSDADRGLVYDSATKLGDYLGHVDGGNAKGWLGSIKGSVRQRTWERYEQLVRVHIAPALGSVKLKNLTRTHVKNLYAEKLDSGSAPRTVQYIHTTLHKALKDAVSDGLIPKNVADNLKPSKSRRHEINPLTPDQAKAFLAAARGDRFAALCVLAVHCGLRQGELLGLKWQDVDLKAGTLQIRRTMSETREGRAEEGTKSGKGRRIELTRTVLEALRSHRERQQQEVEGSDIRISKGHASKL